MWTTLPILTTTMSSKIWCTKSMPGVRKHRPYWVEKLMFSAKLQITYKFEKSIDSWIGKCSWYWKGFRIQNKLLISYRIIATILLAILLASFSDLCFVAISIGKKPRYSGHSCSKSIDYTIIMNDISVWLL